MQIPEKIKVGKKWYTVGLFTDVTVRGKPVLGGVNYGAARIHVATHSPSTKRVLPEREVDNTFWHELTHAILEDMGSKLEADEKFVDAFSTRLSNAVRSAKF
jgi:hypothetical protein